MFYIKIVVTEQDHIKKEFSNFKEVCDHIHKLCDANEPPREVRVNLAGIPVAVPFSYFV